MTDGQWLFTVFAVLYLLECVRWLPGSACVLTGTGLRWRTQQPIAQIEIAGARPAFLSVLPPLQLHLVTLPWLFAPCEEGLEILDLSGPAGALIAWDSLLPKTEGDRLHLAKGQVLKLPDEELAQEWQKRLAAWKTMDQQARERDFLNQCRQTLKAKPLDEVAARLSAQTHALRSLGFLIFIWTFVVVTGTYGWLGEGPEVLMATAALFLLLWAQAITFWLVSNRAPRPGFRFWKSLAIAFLPQHAIRAADLLCRAQPIFAHPLAALGLLDRAAGRCLAARFWKDTRYGRATSKDLQMQALEELFRRHELAVADLEEVPSRGSDSAGYCPRCLGQFRNADAVCRDCGDVPLKEW